MIFNNPEGCYYFTPSGFKTKSEIHFSIIISAFQAFKFNASALHIHTALLFLMNSFLLLPFYFLLTISNMNNKTIINGHPFISFIPENISAEECLHKSENFRDNMLKRRSIRHFSDKPVSEQIIKNILAVGNSAPSGANKQPWTFCVIKDTFIKKQIREAAEKEEYESYHGRMPQEWLDDLAHLQTDWHKPFLETAPYIIIVFKKSYEVLADGRKKNYYYVQESVGIATGFLIAAIHQAGLVTLTHTPSPMNFLIKILNRPENEKPFLVLPVGYAADNCIVPDLKKRNVEDVSVFY